MACIPTELWVEILVRISVEELMRLRGVCSSWRNLIDCPVFRVQHATRPCNFPAQYLLLYLDYEYYLLGLEKISPNNEPTSEPIRARVVRMNGEFSGIHGVICHSYNGLVLRFAGEQRFAGELLAWNAFTGTNHTLPVNDLITERGTSHYGIGLDEISRDCKVVFIRHHYKHLTSDVYVCKLSSPSRWKRMDPLPWPDLAIHGLHGVSVSGALHWLVSHLHRGVSVLAIHLGTETYSLMTHPFTASCYEKLCVLGGCLCIATVNRQSRFEGWVMKEYGVCSSWSMLYDVGAQQLGGEVNIHVPVTYSDCGTQVLISFSGCLVWYHLRNKTVEHIELEGWRGSDERRRFTATEYVGSFLPLGCDTMEKN